MYKLVFIFRLRFRFGFDNITVLGSKRSATFRFKCTKTFAARAKLLFYLLELLVFLTLSLPSPPSLLKSSLVKVLWEGTYAFNRITVTFIKWLRLINCFTLWHKETSKWPKGDVVLTGKDTIIIFLFSLSLVMEFAFCIGKFLVTFNTRSMSCPIQLHFEVALETWSR